MNWASKYFKKSSVSKGKSLYKKSLEKTIKVDQSKGAKMIRGNTKDYPGLDEYWDKVLKEREKREKNDYKK